MKPITLVMQAFGPYKDAVTVDFTVLQNYSMFLITGPTGSGKTTVLDAMVYALYGEPSGDVRKSDSVRSDFADPGTETKVVFDFAIGDALYRVERQPKQDVPKKRGDGTKVQGAKAVVFEWKQDDWTVIAESSGDIKEKIQSIIGFRKEQFLQVVLLPQGEFRKLLISSTADRESLLHTLFKTHIYRKLQDMVKADYNAAEEGVKEALQKQDILLEMVQVDGEAEPVLTIPRLERYIESRQLGYAELVRQRDEAKAAVTKEEEKRNTVKTYESVESSIEKSKCRLSELEGQLCEINKIKADLATLKSLEPSIELYKEIHQCYIDDQSLCNQIEVAQSELQEVAINEEALVRQKEAFQDKEISYKEKQLRYGQLDSHKDELSSALEEDKTCTKLASDVKALALTMKETKEKKVTVETSIAAENAMILERDRWLRAHSTVQGEAEQVKAELASLENLAKDVEALVDEETVIATKGEDLKAAGDALAKATRLVQAVTASMEQGFAYELASHLEPGTPCAVCGATDHPSPAVHPSTWTTKEDVEEAQRAEKIANSEYSGIKSTLAILEDQFKKKKEELCRAINEFSTRSKRSSSIDALHVEMSLSEYKKRLQVLIDPVQVSLDQLNKDCSTSADYTVANDNSKATVKSKEVELKVLSESLQVQEEQQREYNLKIAQITTMLDTLEKQLHIDIKSDWKGEITSLKIWLDQYDKDVKRLQDSEKVLGESRSALVSKQELLVAQKEENVAKRSTYETQWQAQLVSLAMESEDFLGYYERRHEKDAWNDAVKDYDLAVGGEQEVLRAYMEQLAVIEKPIDALDDDAYGVAVAKREDLVSRVGRWEQKDKELCQTLDAVKTLEKSIGTARNRVDFLRKLHELANGGDRGIKNVTFERYVLGAILDEVLYAANLRLHTMSRSRYALERTDYSDGGRGKQGLDLSVMDSYTGVSRPANTLSGGETFLASLALALGLADVIQSYAGGIHMDTMFIDEGFGTLDPDTLDVAMETLVELQHSGRLIGLISHVPELKERIDAHLVVTQKEEGSSVRFDIR